MVDHHGIKILQSHHQLPNMNDHPHTTIRVRRLKIKLRALTKRLSCCLEIYIYIYRSLPICAFNKLNDENQKEKKNNNNKNNYETKSFLCFNQHSYLNKMYVYVRASICMHTEMCAYVICHIIRRVFRIEITELAPRGMRYFMICELAWNIWRNTRQFH